MAEKRVCYFSLLCTAPSAHVFPWKLKIGKLEIRVYALVKENIMQLCKMSLLWKTNGMEDVHNMWPNFYGRCGHWQESGNGFKFTCGQNRPDHIQANCFIHGLIYV